MRSRIVSKKIGELLVECGVITQEQVDKAMKIQQEKGGLLGQILVSLNYVTEEVVAQVLTAQYGFPFLPLKHYTFDAELIRVIPATVARQYCLVPVDRIGDTLTVAMADPLNTKAIEDIEMLTRCSVQIFVSTISDVIEAIERHYGGEP